MTGAHPDSPDGRAEIRAFLARAESQLRRGSHVCFILDSHETQDDLLLQNMIQDRVTITSRTAPDLVCSNPELQHLLDIYGRNDISFQVLAGTEGIVPLVWSAGESSEYHGICDVSQKGIIYFLPVFPVPRDERRFIAGSSRERAGSP